MNSRNKRALTWILVAVGVVLVGLGGVLIATMGDSAALGFPFPGVWARGDSEAARSAAAQAGGPGIWPFHRWGPWMMPGRIFGGGFICMGIAFLFIIFLIRRSRTGRWRPPSHRYYGCGMNDDAVETLRRAFAEGRISDEEYKTRLKTLREGETP